MDKKIDFSKLKNFTSKVLGEVWVDSASVHVADCVDLFDEEGELNEGVVLTPTKYGDGSYPVIGFYEAGDDRPSFIIVDFDDIFLDEEKLDF
jgi:hypothetical protein